MYLDINDSWWEGVLWYRYFSYVPHKISFKINWNFWDSSRSRFYVDGVIYQYLDSDSLTNGSFMTFETPLLQPWIHELEWDIRKYWWNDWIVILDDL